MNTVHADSLESMMEMALQGDETAYSTLLHTIAQKLTKKLAYKLSEQDKEEVVQETLISIHKARHTYDTSRPLWPWVMAIANFRLNDHFRRHYKSKTEELPDQLVAKDVTEDMLEREDVRKEIASLPQKQRRIIEMMYYEDKSVRVVAETIGMKESAVKVAAHRVYKRLREVLK
jgi:RNA polymerase sigma-70 factor (ECF subfamily)